MRRVPRRRRRAGRHARACSVWSRRRRRSARSTTPAAGEVVQLAALAHSARRVRRRRFVALVGAAAVLLVVGGLAGHVPRPAGTPAPPTASASRRTCSSSRSGDVAVTADLTLEKKGWGTRIDWECTYPAGPVAGRRRTDLRARPRRRRRAAAPSSRRGWPATTGARGLGASSSIVTEDIRSVEIRVAGSDTPLATAHDLGAGRRSRDRRPAIVTHARSPSSSRAAGGTGTRTSQCPGAASSSCERRVDGRVGRPVADRRPGWPSSTPPTTAVALPVLERDVDDEHVRPVGGRLEVVEEATAGRPSCAARRAAAAARAASSATASPVASSAGGVAAVDRYVRSSGTGVLATSCAGRPLDLDRAQVRGALLVQDDGQAADRQGHLELPVGVVVRCAREREVREVGADLDVAEEEPPQVLVALLGVHDAERARSGSGARARAGCPARRRCRSARARRCGARRPATTGPARRRSPRRRCRPGRRTGPSGSRRPASCVASNGVVLGRCRTRSGTRASAPGRRCPRRRRP